MDFKYLLYAFVAFMLFSTSSCVDDLGNYDYQKKEELIPVQISGLPNDTLVIRFSQVKMTPILNNMDDESRYTYLWYAIPSSNQNESLPEREILSKTKNLDFKVDLKQGASDYILFFEVHDPKLGVYVQKEIQLKITETEIHLGWYILKDADNETDFDYISFKGTQINDVLKDRNNRLVGQAKMMTYQSQYYHQYWNDVQNKWETLTNQRALHIITSEDMKTFNLKSMSLFKNFENEFYDVPKERKLEYISSVNNYLYMLNAGKLYTINPTTSNIGKFTFKIGTYDLFNEIISYGMGTIVFDKTTTTFYGATTGGCRI